MFPKLKNPYNLAFAIVLFINLILVLALFQLPDKKLHLKVYDVGQGDSILITTASGHRILVDGGPDNKVLGHLGRDLPFWDRKIDFLILTHPQADHMTGLVETIKRYQIGSVLISGVEVDTAVYEEWKLSLKEKGLEPRVIKAGDSISFPDQTKINFIWPKDERPTVTDLNAACLVFKLTYGSFDAYLTGDADSQVQPYTQTEDIEVLKVPHHGSKTALKQDYLEALKPEVSIISAGTRNRYGHPRPELLEMLVEVGSEILRTDINGTVEVVSDGKSWYTKAEKGR